MSWVVGDAEAVWCIEEVLFTFLAGQVVLHELWRCGIYDIVFESGLLDTARIRPCAPPFFLSRCRYRPQLTLYRRPGLRNVQYLPCAYTQHRVCPHITLLHQEQPRERHLNAEDRRIHDAASKRNYQQRIVRGPLHTRILTAIALVGQTSSSSLKWHITTIA